MSPIVLQNVRTNNLQSVSVEIPKRGVTLICGVSGSGKSSLAFDTLYAEGQRRYLETLSSKAMELLARIPAPTAERIDGIVPTIGLIQELAAAPASASTGSETGLHEMLATAWVTAGSWLCEACSQPMARASAADVLQAVSQSQPGEKLLIGFPTGHLGGDISGRLSLLQAGRVGRVVLDGVLEKTVDADDSRRTGDGPLFGVVDRIKAGSTDDGRLADSIEAAFRAGDGCCTLLTLDTTGAWTPTQFNENLACQCGYRPAITLDENVLLPTTRLGACRHCAAKGGTSAGKDCDACAGTGVGEWADRCVWNAVSFRQLLQTPISDVASLDLETVSDALAGKIRKRLELLTRLSLGHMHLARRLDAVSSGEALRVRLCSVLSADVVDTLLVLDEPAAGLSPTETDEVFAAIREFAKSSNGVSLVEHAPKALAVSDHVIEVGPGAGSAGGHIVFNGSAQEFETAETATATAFRRVIQYQAKDCDSPATTKLSISGKRGFLQQSAIEVAVGGITILLGRSGAGKSTLLADLRDQQLTLASENPREAHQEPFADVVFVGPFASIQSSRSCVAIHSKAFDDIRKLFAAVPRAKAMGLTAKHFSFNTSGGGRCERCRGQGSVAVAMGHLSDLSMTCPACAGSRFESVMATIKFRRRSIADVLAMTIDDAVAFFRTEISIRNRLQPIRDVGLGYLTLGRGLNTLSGGESQRLQLANYLGSTTRGATLFLLDEPARGLHPDDQTLVAGVFERLADIGHSILIAEHHAAFVAVSDRIVELCDGKIVFSGDTSSYLRDSSSPIADDLRRRVKVS